MNKLKTSLKNYLKYSSSSREELNDFLTDIKTIGRVAIFGGMIRDFLANDARIFNSDVDLVISCKPGADLNTFIHKYKGTTNKYGGSRISLGHKWSIDLWPIQETWAFKNGLNIPPTLENLYLTPFFSLDAICYLVEENSVLCSENYFELFQNKILDVNCTYTPSDLYLLKKAYRYKMDFDYSFSPELQQRLIIAFEREFIINPIMPIELQKFYHNLKAHISNVPLINFDYQKQLDLMRF